MDTERDFLQVVGPEGLRLTKDREKDGLVLVEELAEIARKEGISEAKLMAKIGITYQSFWRLKSDPNCHLGGRLARRILATYPGLAAKVVARLLYEAWREGYRF